MTDLADRAASLACWSGPVTPRPLSGGMTNANFVVEDRGARYVVRIGGDIPHHGILRRNELAASRAAAEIGVSPPVFHAEPGALVVGFIEGRTFTPEAISSITKRSSSTAKIFPTRPPLVITSSPFLRAESMVCCSLTCFC